jgi:hypothetical protein
MRIYTVEEASEITGVSATDILDAVRTGQLSAYGAMEPSFPVPYTDKRVRHRSYIGISADELDSIHPDLDHRWQCLAWLESVEDENDALHYVEQGLLAWYGAVLDDPNDREAAGVIQGLTAFASYLGLRQDGTRDRSEAAPLRAAA